MRLIFKWRVGGLARILRLLFLIALFGFPADLGAAEDLADQISIKGSACDITILNDKIIGVHCSPGAGILTLVRGNPTRFRISLMEKGWDGEYLIEEVSLDYEEDTLRRRRLTDSIALCVSDSVCEETTDVLIDSNFDTCLQQGRKADAVSFLEYNGDVLPLGASGQLITCQDSENLTVVAAIAMGQSTSEEYNPDTAFGLLIIVDFPTGD